MKEIREIIGEDGELFVQATATTAEGMVEEAHKIVEVLGKTTLVKIPCVPEGFKAMKQLKKEGIRFIGTAIYTAMQGFLAAKCGASTTWASMAYRSQWISTMRSLKTAWTAAFLQQASRTASRSLN